MIMCGDKTVGNGDIEEEGSVCPSRQTSGGGLKRRSGTKKHRYEKYQQNLGPKSSLYEVGTSPPHNSDTPNGLVSSKTTTTTRICVSNLKG